MRHNNREADSELCSDTAVHYTDAVLYSLNKLIDRAEAEGKWLHTNPRSKLPVMWISPADLRRENAAGRYIWAPQNWVLLDPAEYVAEAQADVDRAVEELERRKAAVAAEQS